MRTFVRGFVNGYVLTIAIVIAICLTFNHFWHIPPRTHTYICVSATDSVPTRYSDHPFHDPNCL